MDPVRKKSPSLQSPHIPDAIPADCPELGLEVAVAAIDKELHQLWEQDEARTNASLMNLVVYSEHAGSLRENSAIITQSNGSTRVERRIEAPGFRVCSLAPADPTLPAELVALQLARGGKNS